MPHFLEPSAPEPEPEHRRDEGSPDSDLEDFNVRKYRDDIIKVHPKGLCDIGPSGSPDSYRLDDDDQEANQPIDEADGEEEQKERLVEESTAEVGAAVKPQISITRERGDTRGLRRRWWARGKERLSNMVGIRHSRLGADGGNLLIGDGPQSASTDCGSTAPADDSSATFCWQVVNRDGDVLAEENGAECSPPISGSVEAKVEQLLTWMLAPAVHGILKLGVPGAADRAGELLAERGRDVEAAVREVVAGSERTVSAMVLNFCIERIPVLGCPTVLLRTTWGNLRSIFIIAALYGHDLESPRVQHEALLCLVPPGEDKESASAAALGPGLVGETTQRVARMMIRGALRQVTGLQAAVDCFELASLLYSSCGSEGTDEDGFVHVLATPASAARDLFRRKSFASCILLWCSLPLLILGVAAPGLFVATRFAPTAVEAAQTMVHRLPRSVMDHAPALLLALLGLWLMLFLANRGKQQVQQKKCRAASRWGRLGRLMPGRHLFRRVLLLRSAWPQLITTLVFALHALLPALSIYSATTVIISSLAQSQQGWNLLHGSSCGCLGLYSLCSVLVRQLPPERKETDWPPLDRLLRIAARFCAIGCTAARVGCFLAAWTYVSLALDLAATRIFYGAAGVAAQRSTPLGVLSPLAWLLGAEHGDANPLHSEKAWAFLLHLVSVASQQRLVELLGRREVLLRLIGAERVTASTVCLLLKGVAVACSSSSNPIAEFLTRVAPHPVCVVLIVAFRGQAIVVGIALVLAPMIASGEILGPCSSFLAGLLAGSYAAHSILSVWFVCRPDLDSPALRLALLVPGGVSGHAKGLLRGVMGIAGTRAVQIMAMGVIDRITTWWCRLQHAVRR